MVSHKRKTATPDWDVVINEHRSTKIAEELLSGICSSFAGHAQCVLNTHWSDRCVDVLPAHVTVDWKWRETTPNGLSLVVLDTADGTQARSLHAHMKQVRHEC